MTRLVRAPLLFAALLAVTTGSAYADGLETKGKGALMFDYGGLFTSTPSAFDAVGVGGRYFLTEALALRGGIGLLIDTQSTDVGSRSEEDSQSRVGFEGALEVVVARTRSAYFYTGGLLQVSKFAEDPQGPSNNVDRLDFTMAGMLGVTYFIVDGLSIGAEYRLGLNYGAQTDERPGDADIESTRMTIGVGTVGFHLSFWFG